MEIFSGLYATDSIVIVFHIYLSVNYPRVCDLFGPFQLPGLVSQVGPPFRQVISNVNLWGLVLSNLHDSNTRPLVRRLENLTIIGRFGSLLVSPSCGCGGSLPRRWDTSISFIDSLGSSFKFSLQIDKILSSVIPGKSSGTPKTRIDPRRPCCSKSSIRTSRSWFCLVSFLMASYFASSWRRSESMAFD